MVANEKNKSVEYKLLNSNVEILNEIKSLSTFNNNEGINCISLSDISRLINKINDDYYEIVEEYQSLFNDTIKSKFSGYIGVIIDEFDYNLDCLNITLIEDYGDYKKVSFTKKDDNLCVVESESVHTDEILQLLYSELSNLYDELYRFTEYKGSYSSSIRTSNSNFFADINSCFVKILSNKYESASDFRVIADGFNNKYHLKCDSLVLYLASIRKKEELFKNTFVRISDCPKWCQEELYKIRQNQLENNKSTEDKKLELIKRKIHT